MICPGCKKEVTTLTAGVEVWTVKGFDSTRNLAVLDAVERKLSHDCGQGFVVFSSLAPTKGLFVGPEDPERDRKAREFAEDILSTVQKDVKQERGDSKSKRRLSP